MIDKAHVYIRKATKVVKDLCATIKVDHDMSADILEDAEELRHAQMDVLEKTRLLKAKIINRKAHIKMLENVRERR